MKEIKDKVLKLLEDNLSPEVKGEVFKISLNIEFIEGLRGANKEIEIKQQYY